MEVKPFADRFYILDDTRVRQFLFVGDREALLIDTGFEDSHVYEQVRTITSLPVKVVLTHGDLDHCGGAGDFPVCYLHENDWPLLGDRSNGTIRSLKQGDVFSCAGYQLETIELPGHTWGSVAFIERKRRWLFSGDSVQKEGPIYMFGEHRNMAQYLLSLEKLMTFADSIDWIFPCHGECPMETVYIERNYRDAHSMMRQNYKGERHPKLPCMVYTCEWTKFYTDR